MRLWTTPSVASTPMQRYSLASSLPNLLIILIMKKYVGEIFGGGGNLIYFCIYANFLCEIFAYVKTPHFQTLLQCTFVMIMKAKTFRPGRTLWSLVLHCISKCKYAISICNMCYLQNNRYIRDFKNQTYNSLCLQN